MAQNLTYLFSPVSEAQRRLRDTTPRTTAWLDAQREAVHARVDYWTAMCLEWDLDHPTVATGADLPSCRRHSVLV
jgi:hypothetical protein